MAAFHQRFVGATELPKSLTDIEIGLSFRLSSEDVQALRARFRDRRLGAAVLLVFTRASGRSLARMVNIPRSLLQYLCVSLELGDTAIATLKSLYQRPATLSEHNQWVRKYCGLVEPDASAFEDLRQTLDALAATASSTDELVRHAEVWLFDRKHLLPGDRVLRDVAREAFAGQEAAALRVVKTQIPTALMKKALAAAFASRMGRGGGSNLEWLKTGPGKHGRNALAEVSKKLVFLKSIGVDTWSLSGLSSERLKAYAKAVTHRPPFETKRLSNDQQQLEMACFLRAALLELTDAAFYMAGRRLSDFVRAARNKIQVKQARNAATYLEREACMRALVHARDTTDRQKVAALQEMLPERDARRNLTRAALVRESLAEERVRLAAVLSAFGGIEIQGTKNDGALQQIKALRDLRSEGARALPDGFDASMTDPVWHELINGADRGKALGALQASAVMAVHRGLRGGSLWVDHSWKHRNREDMLIPADEWERQRKRLVGAMGLFADPRLYIKRMRHNIEAALQALSEAVAAGKLEIDQEGLVRLPALSAQDLDPQVTRSRDAMFKIIGSAQLGNIIVEVDAQAGVSEVLLGHRAQSRGELLACYGALLALGTENDAKGVAAMIPDIEVSHVAAAMRTLENAERLRKANDRVVAFQQQHPVSALWGKGERASADMMSVDASRHLFNARVDPRRRTFAAGIYTHVMDSYGVFYDQPIVLNTRQAAAAVHGAH